MKRLLCLLCIGCLLLGGSVLAWADEEEAATDAQLVAEPAEEAEAPQAAPETMDYAPMEQELTSELSQELTQVTQRVKNLLEIDDSYTSFYGQYYDQNGRRIWYLNWESDNSSVSVEASPSGQIFSYHSYQYGNYGYDANFAPSFTNYDTAAIESLAQGFLRKVLQNNESVTLDSSQLQSLSGSRGNYAYFYGNIQQNNVDTPFTYGIDIDTRSMKVTNFYRESLNNSWREYQGSFPSAVPSISQAVARQTLAEHTELELGYYLTEEKVASLQYRPRSLGRYVVDAQTGAVVDLSESGDYWYYNDYGYYGASATADSAGGGSRLSPVEEQGISNLANLLTQAQLLQYARGISGLDLTGAELQNISYQPDWQNREVYYANLYLEGPVTAQYLGITEETLQQLQNLGREFSLYYNITLNARTGALESFYIYGGYVDEVLVTLEKSEYLAEATAFLEANFPELAAQTVLREDDNAYSYNYDYNTYNFVQEVDGYPFPNNYLNVETNPYTGQISYFAKNWQEDISFQPATGLISADAARQTFSEALEYPLAYINQPIETAGKETWDWPQRLVLAYKAQLQSGEQNLYGIDATSGEKLYRSDLYSYTFEYDDLDGVTNRDKIEALSSFGVGYTGGSFKADATMRELDMLLFLVSANGTYFEDSLDETNLADLYREAQYLGIFSGERNPERQISRGEFVKTIISMSGYGKAALIPNIYQLNLSNASSIPDDLAGYLAIAQGLGMLERGGSFNASGTLDREEAALIFYYFLDRQY